MRGKVHMKGVTNEYPDVQITLEALIRLGSDYLFASAEFHDEGDISFSLPHDVFYALGGRL